MAKFDYKEKFEKFDKTKFNLLNLNDRFYLEKIAFQFYLTFQEFNNMGTILLDLEQWEEKLDEKLSGKKVDSKGDFIKEVDTIYSSLKEKKSYVDFKGKDNVLKTAYHIVKEENVDAKIMGRCPVASPKTLCCNLETLDAFRNCSYGCSYCSIQSYFNENEIIIDADFKNKLQQTHLDPDRIYHIGTGQSSDSLLWGNKEGHLDELIEFARKNPNLILEFKTKSANVEYLLSIDIPPNVITTWSINPDRIIDNEEHRTANLESRLNAASKIVAKGNLVGFHLHPIIYYEEFKDDYKEVIEKILSRFRPEDVALVSLGTVTFNKKTINEIRNKKITSKILQMPFSEIAGKYSYPIAVKEEIFSTVYEAFTPWHKSVFFYLCMEAYEIWDSVFKYRYQDNDDFEKNMKASYMQKINLKHQNRSC